MKYFHIPTILAAITINGASADQPASFIGGNWYKNSVQGITYSNFGMSGQYNRITDMTDGQCSSEPFAFQGGMSPMDGEISWHFRGPMHLKQFAAYVPGSSTTKQDLKATPHQRRHGHGVLHHHDKRAAGRAEQRGVDDWITATINGQIVSWANPSANQATAAPYTKAGGEHDKHSSGAAPSSMSSGPTNPHVTLSPYGNSPAPTMNPGAGNWWRQAYYNAEQSQADGLVFLNNHGGAGSGVFDYNWGASLSYASSDASTGSASPQILQDGLLADNNEFSIFTDKQCQGGSCGYVRPGTVAYHGFDGASKLFLFEFDMPLTNNRDWNGDMPAIWTLNAQIPRTLQYGAAECSCWTSGCGEWDIFEVLDSGNTRCKSTVHSTRSGGDSNYFERPVDKTMKAAVIFDGEHEQGQIVVLPDDFTFDTTLPQSAVLSHIDSIAQSSYSRFELPI